MTRTEKYPETSTFHYHNQNPKNRITGDCVFRAISYATKTDYRQVIMDYAELFANTCYDDDKTVEMLLNEYGWKKQKQLRKTDGKKYTVKDFVNEFKNGTYIIKMAHHLSVVENGKNVDIWDCVKFGGTVGNYYVKVK